MLKKLCTTNENERVNLNMKTISLTEQRKMFKAYKEARLSDANTLIALYNTGNYNRPQNSEIINEAKEDIIKFVSVFEEKVIKEAKNELYR